MRIRALYSRRGIRCDSLDVRTQKSKLVKRFDLSHTSLFVNKNFRFGTTEPLITNSQFTILHPRRFFHIYIYIYIYIYIHIH